MGYYSETAIALTACGAAALHEKLAAAEPELLKEVEYLLNSADRRYQDKDSQAELWHWQDIKWHENEPEFYPDILFMQELLDSLDEEDYRFIRIGEDYDDTEVRGWFTENPFDLELARSISLQAPIKPAAHSIL